MKDTTNTAVPYFKKTYSCVCSAVLYIARSRRYFVQNVTFPIKVTTSLPDSRPAKKELITRLHA